MIKRLTNYTLFACTCLLIVISCSKDKAVEPSECYDSNFVVSFNDHIWPIVQKSCGSSSNCHAAGAGPQPVYADYDDLKAKVDDGTLEVKVLEKLEMPPSWGPDSVQITDCERELFRLWIEAGAPNN